LNKYKDPKPPKNPRIKTNRILNNLQRISFATPSINSLYNELHSYKNIIYDFPLKNNFSFSDKISLINLNYIYDKKKFP
jgi:hypothetical protein